MASSSARRSTSWASYVDAIEGELPTLRQDLIALADVADTYDAAAPDLLRVLGNLTVTGRTVIEKRQALDVFFGDVTDLSDTTPPGARRQRVRR